MLIKAKRGRPVGSKNKPKAMTHGSIELLKAEISEAIELQRAHFPNDDELTLRYRAEQFRPYRYKEARWPDFAAVAKREAAEKAAAAAARAAEDQLPTTPTTESCWHETRTRNQKAVFAASAAAWRAKCVRVSSGKWRLSHASRGGNFSGLSASCRERRM